MVVGSLRRGEGGPARLLRSLAQVWTQGVDVDWPALFADADARRVSLPTYAFQRERYWLDPAAGAGAGEASSIGMSSAGDHPLLGCRGRPWPTGGAGCSRVALSLESHPWLRDHGILGEV